MALTDSKKAKIRLCLGLSDINRYLDSRLEGLWTGLSLDAEAEILDNLEKFDKVEAALLDVALTNAGVKRVDEIWFFEAGAQRRELQRLGRMYVGRISIILGVPIYSDVFGKDGYLGDSFWPGLGQPSRRGGIIPLG